MKKGIFFSVVVPIYNSEDYLSKCIESIINQEYKNLEIILIDDGSTDHSIDICNRYASVDKRIVVIHQGNHGLVYSRKKGVQIATGEYIAFVDSDDSIDTNMFSRIAEVLSENNTDIVAFGLKEIYSDRVTIKDNKYSYSFYDKNQIEKQILPTMISYSSFFCFGMLPNLVCKVVKRELIKQICSNVEDIVTVGEDADFSFQLISQANSIRLIDFQPYNYFKRNDSMMYKPIEINRIYALQNDLLRCFENNGLSYLMKEQVNSYISFVKALKCPDHIETINTFFADNRRSALYGAGGFGYALFETFRNHITCWTDKNSLYYQKQGIPVVSVEEFIENDSGYDCIFISILNVRLCKQIREDLLVKGICKDIYYFDGNRICS